MYYNYIQIWLVLTKSGLVLRKEKDFNKSKKVFEIVSLQKGIYMTHSDTMNIGENIIIFKTFNLNDINSNILVLYYNLINDYFSVPF